MANKKASVDYRKIKKILNNYYTFTFKMPKTGKDFTPQQKSAITRKLNRIKPYLNKDLSINKSEVTFLKYPEHHKLPGVDGIRADKGLIYKWPNAELKKSRVEKNKYLIVVNPKIKKGAKLMQKRRDIFIPFPKRIQHNPNLISAFVERMKKKYRPHAVQWSYRDTRSRAIFDIEKLELYISDPEEENDFSYIRELIEWAVKKYKNLLSSDDKKRKAAEQRFIKSNTYQLLDTMERQDFWAGLNYFRSARRDDFTYNGVFFVYFL